MKKCPTFILAASSLCLLSSAMGEATYYDPFDEPPAWGPPPNWVSDEPSRDHASIVEGSLYFTGLSESQGNRMVLGESTADYNFDFSDINLAPGETLYFSYLVRIEIVNDFGDLSPMLRLYDRHDQHGSGISIGHGSEDISTGKMAFSLNNRQRGYKTKEAVRTEEEFPIGETYLLVGSYTRPGNGGQGGVALWVNPTQLGTPAAPEPTLTQESYQDDEIWNRLAVRVNGSSSHPERWSIDEVRMGKSWADVTPTGDTTWIPEPSSYALGFGAVVVLALALRRRRGK